MAASVGALRRLAASLVAIGRIRLELFSIEVQEEKRRIADLLFWSVLAALAVGFAGVFVAVWLTVLLWDAHRTLVLAGAGLAWVVLAAVAVVRVRALVARESTLFEASLGELRRDEAALRGTDRAGDAATVIRPPAPTMPPGAPDAGPG